MISDTFTNIAGASTREIALAPSVASTTSDASGETTAMQQLVAFRTH